MHAFMQHTNRDAKRFQLCNHTFGLFLRTDLWVYVIASYLNKVGVSFLWVVRGLGLHACSNDCSYFFFYKHLSDTQ